MTLKEIRDAHELERIGYYRESWNPIYYITLASDPENWPTGGPILKWLVQRPMPGHYVQYYLEPNESDANDWSYIEEDAFTNYSILLGARKDIVKGRYTQ